MEFTVVLIPRYYVIYDLPNMLIQKSAYEDSDSDTDSELSHALSEASSVSTYQLRKKDKGTKNVVERKDAFDTQQLEESFKMFKNYKKYGTSDRVQKLRKTVENKKYHLRSDNDETLDSIEPVTAKLKKGNRNPINQQTERCVKMNKNQREYSFERKTSSLKRQRKRPSSPEESKKKKQKIKMDDFFQNASILPDGSDSEGIRSTKPAYQTFEETGNNDRKRKDQGNGKTAKRSGRNTTNSSSKKKAEEVRSLYNEGYYTDNINSDSLHQESEYQDITDDDINPKNKKKKPNKKEDWSDKALEDFLETLREQPVKEMNDRRNKWIMFSKRLQKKGTNKTNDDCRKQVFTINSLSHVKGSWGMYPSLGEMLNMTLLSYIIQV